IRCEHPLFGLYGLAALQAAPVTLRNILRSCPLHIEFSGPVDLQSIAVTEHIMIYAKRLKPVAVHLKCLLRSLDLPVNNRKRKLRCDHPETAHDTLQPFRADQCQRLPPVCISHGKEQAGKPADMIPVIMCKTDHIDRFKTPSSFFYRDLGPLPAV